MKLTRSPARLWRSIAHGAVRLLDSLWQSLVVWPLKLLATWRTSDSLKFLAGGLPALLLLLGVVVLTAKIKKRTDRETQYYMAAGRAFENEDYETSRIYYDRLLEIQGPRNETLFKLMQIAEMLGDQERFVLLLNRLAPLNELVYGPAHLKKANLLLADVSGPADFGTITRAETQLKHALRDLPNSIEVRAVLGNLYMMTSKPRQAIEQLEPVVDELPGYLLMLSHAYASVGNQDAARKYGLRAQDYYRQLAEAEPTNRLRRVEWAEATSFLEQFPEAIEILQQGMVSSDKSEYRQAVVQVYVSWFDYLLRQPNPDDAAMLRVLQSALDVAPNEPALFQRVMMVLKYEGHTATQIRAKLTNMLAKGESTPLVHLILGTDAGKRGNYELAIRHLEIAAKQDPTMLIAANNLAWYLAHKDSPDLDAAFALADTVARRWPENPYVLDTRGQILARQGKYEDALFDLTTALPKLPDYAPIHVTLGQIYRELGMNDLASQHESLARELAGPKTDD